MAKLTLTDISSGYSSTSTINTNNGLIETALENTLSRDGTSPNTMSANLDMNSNKVVNVTDPTGNQDAATKAYVDLIATGSATTTVLTTGSATFSTVLTGFATALDVSLNYQIVDDICTVSIYGSVTGTSNANTMTFTDWPSVCRPAATARAMCVVQDSGSPVHAMLEVGASGTNSFKILASGVYSSTGFTSSGTKGLPTSWCITYPLNGGV